MWDVRVRTTLLELRYAILPMFHITETGAACRVGGRRPRPSARPIEWFLYVVHEQDRNGLSAFSFASEPSVAHDSYYTTYSTYTRIVRHEHSLYCTRTYMNIPNPIRVSPEKLNYNSEGHTRARAGGLPESQSRLGGTSYGSKNGRERAREPWPNCRSIRTVLEKERGLGSFYPPVRVRTRPGVSTIRTDKTVRNVCIMKLK